MTLAVASRRVRVPPLDAVVEVAIADPSLGDAVTSAIEAAVHAGVERAASQELPRVVHLRTRKRLAELGPERIAGAVVVVRVTEKSARHLVSLVDALRPHAAGVQLVWDGETPPRERVERHVFAALERARGSAGAPVVLAGGVEPVFALRVFGSGRPAGSPR